MPNIPNRRRQVITMYDNVLIRAPENAAMVLDWAGWLNVNYASRLDTMYWTFLDGPEIKQVRPLASVDAAGRRMDRLYRTAFNIDPSTSAINYWANRIFDAPDPEAEWQWVITYFLNHSSHNTYRASGNNGFPAPCA